MDQEYNGTIAADTKTKERFLEDGPWILILYTKEFSFVPMLVHSKKAEEKQEQHVYVAPAIVPT